MSLAADVGGDCGAPPVILMHGGGQTRHSWRGVMRHLVREGYYTISLDTRGHGQSDWSLGSEYTLEHLASDLLRVIDTLEERPALVGASLGGCTGLYAVGQAAKSIATALVMVDVVPRVDPLGAQRVLDFMAAHSEGFANLEEVSAAIAKYNPRRSPGRDAASLKNNVRLRANGRLYWHWDPNILAETSRLHPRDIVDPLLAAAKRVTIPTALVRGKLSDVVSDAGADELRNIIPNLEIFTVPRAGHMVAGDQNDAFNRAVTEFLRRHHPVAKQQVSP